MSELYTQRAQQVIALAELEARRQGLPHVAPVHLVAALLREGSGIGACTLKALGLDLPTLQRTIDQVTHVTPPAVPSGAAREVSFDAAAQEIMVETAGHFRRQLGHNYVGTEHILLALLDDQQVQQVLEATGVTPAAVQAEMRSLLQLSTVQPSAATPLHRSLTEVIGGARQTAEKMGHKAVRPEHILLAVLEDPATPALAQFLTEHGVTAEALQQHLRQHR